MAVAIGFPVSELGAYTGNLSLPEPCRLGGVKSVWLAAEQSECDDKQENSGKHETLYDKTLAIPRYPEIKRLMGSFSIWYRL